MSAPRRRCSRSSSGRALLRPDPEADEGVEPARVGLGRVDRIFAMLERVPTVVDGGKKTAPPVISRVSFEDVVFGYGEIPVLDHVTLEAKKGEVIALVGESGLGKTTLVSLLPRFYDVAGGRLAFDGVDRELTLASLRERVAICRRTRSSSDDTVRENIRLGRPGATDDEITPRRRPRRPTASSARCRRATRPCSASAGWALGRAAPADPRSRARSSATRRCSSSTKRRAHSTARASARSRTRSRR